MVVEAGEQVDDQEGELHYKCGGHARWFPDEVPERHWSEFSVDPVTLVRKRTYCRRCDNRQKAQYSRNKQQWHELSALERVQDTFAKEEERLEKLVREGRGGSSEVARVRWHLSYLAEQLQGLDSANHEATDAKEESEVEQ